MPEPEWFASSPRADASDTTEKEERMEPSGGGVEVPVRGGREGGCEGVRGDEKRKREEDSCVSEIHVQIRMVGDGNKVFL